MISELEKMVSKMFSPDCDAIDANRQFRLHLLLANLYADNNDGKKANEYFGYAEFLYGAFLRPDENNIGKQAVEFGIPLDARESFHDLMMEKYKKNYWNYIIAAGKISRLDLDGKEYGKQHGTR